uniref:Proline rich 16 n=1 Tax=Lepisosteus oculatus TaxID=7918 RepID=W5MQP5_LEPOC|nr:PREDICTED: protein Largen isoform X1 [Lepisosteus oculatus]
MSGKSKAESSEGTASKAKVKEQIKTIVEDLEIVLGDLKDVAKELKEKSHTSQLKQVQLLVPQQKEVVHQIDSLTCDLQLEEEMTDSSKTDTLNSSSSSTTTTTASSIEKVKLHSEGQIIKALPAPPAILTVLKKPNPPPPPPRLTPVRCDDLNKTLPSGNPLKTNGTLLRNGALALPGIQKKVPNGDVCCISKNIPEKVPIPPLLLRPDKDRCPQATRERVRFSEKVQYHGYCPDCDVRYDIKNRDVHLHTEPLHTKLKPPHHCLPPPPPLPPFENGGIGISISHSFPPVNPGSVPHPVAPKPQKTILRKSTTTTV